MTLTFVSSSSALGLDADLPLLLDAARERGFDAELTVWDDPAVDWSAYDAVVVRSCWDYVARHQEFLAWAASVPHLHNTHDVLAWNTDKTYLQQLQDAGVPIIETRWDVAAGDDIGDHAEWVVKPSVSAGSMDTARWGTREEVWAHSAALVAAGRTSITQPYVASVDEEGETAMLFFGDEFSHAIRKGQLLQAGEGIRQDRAGRETIDPRTPTPAQHAVAVQALAASRDALGEQAVMAYARVDLVTAADGAPLVIELELVEPSLFLPHADPQAPTRLIDAVLAQISR